MTESNPPAQLEELRRRILFYLGEELNRGVDHPHLHAIADALNETEGDIRRQSEILGYQGLVELRWYIGGGALVELLPKGKLELEKMAQEFQHSADYASVNWRGQAYQFNRNQATCVRLLHEAWLEGTPHLSGHYLLTTIEGAVKMSGLFRDHPAWKELILPLTNPKASYRLNLPPKIPLYSPQSSPNTPEKRP